MTIQNTPVYALPYPQSGDPADAPSQLQALCARIEAVLQPIEAQGKVKDTTVGSLGARPASTASLAGRHYFATDVVADYVDTGTAWVRTTIPAGTIAGILGTVPVGWFLCDGTAIANSGITVELYAAIGATRPDLRGRVPVGVDGAAARLTGPDLLGEASGIEKHPLAVAELPNHDHTISAGKYVPANATVWTLASVAAGGDHSVAARPSGGAFGAYNATDTRGSSIAHQNMQPYQIVNWMVKV